MSSQFTPTPAELALVNQIFAQSDPQKIGIITGEVAVRVFGGAKLAPSVLGKIWNIADEDNNGFLTRKGVAVAVRLIAWAQKGEQISQALLAKSGPLATIDGIHVPLAPQGTGMSIPKSPPPGLPLLTPQDKSKFAKLFQTCGPVGGLVSGEKARDVFVKSKLPVDKLSQIWSLADTQDRGALDLTDFTIAMYLIQAMMSGQLSFAPTTLPPGLYEQAGGGTLATHATGGSARLTSPTSYSAPGKQPPVQTNLTGQLNPPPSVGPRRLAPTTQSPAAPLFSGIAPQATGLWDVTPVEKASADRFFDTLDSHKRGFIEGDVAVPFMLQSKLPEDVLAQVWDLADINNDGRLTRDGFAVAMHLIQGKLSGKEIPATLPQTLVPPSMRSNGLTSPFATTAQPTEAIRDLLWDDSPPSSAVNVQPQPNVLRPQTTGMTLPAISPPPVSRLPHASDDPFTPAGHNSFHKDLLGDDDETHPSASIHDQSAEIGNLQNQVNSTSASLQSVKSEREALETTLANQAAQLSSLQTQLATAKASFEVEMGLLNTLKERHANQNVEIQKAREELIRNESDLSAIRVEKVEIEGSFLRDKEEVRELNRRMGEVATQITATKQEVDKVKKDAKHQKGLLAIARKQLATKEAEKTKVDVELQEAQEDLTDTVKELEEAEAEKPVLSQLPEPERSKSPADSLSFAAAQPLPVTPDTTGAGPLSPTSGKSNNPFERLAMSTGISTPRSQSPFRSFSAAPISHGSPAPPTAAAATTLDDPFGITLAFGQDASEVAPDTDTADAGATTPKGRATFGESSDVVSSPTEEDMFSTPPNSITPVNGGGDSTPHFRSLDSAAVHFPELDDAASGPGDGKDGGTDLSTDLHDLDVNETDSDSDSDAEKSHEGRSLHVESHPPKVSPIGNESAPSVAPVSFDDIFGASNDAPAVVASPVQAAEPPTDSASPAQNGSAAVDAFGMPMMRPGGTLKREVESRFSFLDAPSTVGSSGMSSFDDAFGKSSSNTPGQMTSSFSFDSAFEDNFDFSASSGAGTEFASTASSEAPANGNTAIKPTVTETANSTQPIFPLPANGLPARHQGAAGLAPLAPVSSFPSPWSATSSEKMERTVEPPGVGGISFEEAFGGVDTSQALKLADPFTSRAPTTPATAATAPQPDAAKQFPTASTPTSPRGPVSPRVATSIRPSSPQPRAMSPPPRVASPKAHRSSTSSSTKEAVHEKPAPPPRHSKISLRLPFGRKKKQETLPPMPAPPSGQPLPRMEEPGVVSVPGVDDDVQPVKQLTAMGFTRDQAVTALETYDYDVPRALNSLLGAQ